MLVDGVVHIYVMLSGLPRCNIMDMTDQSFPPLTSPSLSSCPLTSPSLLSLSPLLPLLSHPFTFEAGLLQSSYEVIGSCSTVSSLRGNWDGSKYRAIFNIT